MFLAFAVVYYSFYYNAGLVLSGEGGSNALIAMRINEGWLPIRDMFIGYNIMWFLPLSGMYALFGPHLLLTQIFFLFLCVLTGAIGYLLVRRVTGQSWPAALAGGFMILMPGAFFRNYMGFIGVFSASALVFGFVMEHASRIRRILWMAYCGAALSLCFLIRIEPMLLVSAVLLGLVILYPFRVGQSVLARLRELVLGMVAMVAAFAMVHTPVLIATERAGYGPEFRAQYRSMFEMIVWELEQELKKWMSARDQASRRSQPILANLVPLAQTPAPQAEVVLATVPAPPPADTYREERRKRPGLVEILQWKGSPFFALSLYFPVLSAPLFSLMGVALFLHGALKKQSSEQTFGLALLATTGCALSLFPQYFFFRPDSVHLAEFLVPFYAASAIALWAGMQASRASSQRLPWRVAGGLVAFVAALQFIVPFNGLFGREGSGSICLARGKTALFTAENGTAFRVSPKDLPIWEGLRDTILANSAPGEYVVTFPYVPLLNVITNRPSYQRRLYVDNATAGPTFVPETLADFEKFRPAVVVIDNRKINNTEASRFKNWAAPVYEYLLSKYRFAGEFGERFEVFVNVDKVPGNP